MICVGYACDTCKHQRENIGGWKCACDAFPDGIPIEHMAFKHRDELAMCNNGIGYEEDPEAAILFADAIRMDYEHRTDPIEGGNY